MEAISLLVSKRERDCDERLLEWLGQKKGH